ncbi:Gamma-aminobutyric acid type B receptor subunit 1-like [Oopsacas minuta]|uniref:Gamma-aminobutyric acid type B receptor subunit 1-like n=1 Tax=Oopsacas minuta TaxID=111878 RepID=A0AAV7JBA3_9METZ|nr:Gamma-aminobutyric acid type B receptor subunit 1-like [Oopsacas minuta]
MHYYTHVLLVIVLVSLHCLCIQGDSNNTLQTINIAGLYSSSNTCLNSEAIRIVADFAIEIINNDSNILRDYVLSINWKDSECSRRKATNKFIEFIEQKDVIYHMAFGPFCSSAVEPLGLISPTYSLNIFSPTASSPSFTNQRVYPTVMLGVPTSKNLVVLYLNLIEKYEWRRIGIIKEDNHLFNNVFLMLSDKLKREKIDFDFEIIYNSSDFVEIDAKLERLFKIWKYKIMIGDFYQDSALNIACRAYKQNFYYPHVTWILPSRFTESWLKKLDDSPCDYTGEDTHNYCCTVDEINTFLQGAIGVDIVVRLKNHSIATNDTISFFKPYEKTVFGISRELLWNKVISRIYETTEHINPNIEKYTLYAFDSMVTLAYLFDIALKKDKMILSDFNYHQRNVTRNNQISRTLANGIDNIVFSGLSGIVSYENRVRKMSPGEIVEFVNGIQELRGIIPSISLGDLMNITEDSDIIIIQEFTYFGIGESGFDGAELHILPIALTAIASIFSIFACSYTTFFFFIIVIFRNKKIITLSSPVLNIAILVGSFLNCLVAILVLFDNRVFDREPEDDDVTTCTICTIYCHIAWWIPALATDLIFGILVGKSYVAHRLGKDSSYKLSRYSVSYILLFVFALMLLDTVLVIIWGFVPSIKFEYIAYGPLETFHWDVTKAGSTYWYLFFCQEGGRRNNSIGITIRFIYIFIRWIIYGVGLYYASQISRLYISGVHEFRTISRSIVTTVIFNLFRVILLTSILNVRLSDAATTFLSFSYSLDTCIIMSHIFVPKLYYIIKDPNEEIDYAGVHNTANLDPDSFPQIGIHKEKEKLSKLRREHNILEREIQEFKHIHLQEIQKYHKSTTTTELDEVTDLYEQVVSSNN